MGPNIQNVERRSQATPFAENLLAELMGIINQGKGAQTVGPQQRQGVGTGGQQTLGSFASNVGGTNTAASVSDFSGQLIDAITKKSKANTRESAAAIREEQGILGNRFGSSNARGQARLQSDANMNLDQLVAAILTQQGDRQQAARQFDVGANQAALNPVFQLASQGILPEEVIASPSLASQLLGGGLNAAAAYLAGGGKIPFFGGGGGGLPNRPAALPMPNIPQFSFPNTGGGAVGNPTIPTFFPTQITSSMPLYDPRMTRRY